MKLRKKELEDSPQLLKIERSNPVAQEGDQNSNAQNTNLELKEKKSAAIL